MARKPISMRKFREILRLKYEPGLTNRQVGSSLRLSHVSVGNYLADAAAAGLGWPLPADCNGVNRISSHSVVLLRLTI